MATYFADPVKPVVDESSYRDVLETVAPGVTTLIDSAIVQGEQWYDALTRILPSIDCNDEQQTLLVAIAARAKSGLYPIGYTPPPVTVPVGEKPSLEKILTWISIGSLALKLFD